jgi:hypothetical protein
MGDLSIGAREKSIHRAGTVENELRSLPRRINPERQGQVVRLTIEMFTVARTSFAAWYNQVENSGSAGWLYKPAGPGR